MMAENSFFNSNDVLVFYYEDIRLKVEEKRNRLNKWAIPAHLKTALEQSIQRGKILECNGAARIK